jgi:hypothetical protein
MKLNEVVFYILRQRREQYRKMLLQIHFSHVLEVLLCIISGFNLKIVHLYFVIYLCDCSFLLQGVTCMCYSWLFPCRMFF